MKRNLHLNNIIVFLRYMAFFIVVYTIIVQPAAETIKIFNHDFYELTDFNAEDDRNNDEEQEEDTKNEKIEFHTINNNYHYYSINKESSTFANPNRQWNFSQEIPIPPPQRI